MPSAPGLRERKKERTRHDLAAAALRLFVERGFEAVKVEDIAAAAEVSERTFFRYFASKEDVLWPDQAARRDEFAAALDKVPAGESLLGCLRRGAVFSAEAYEADRDEMLARFRLLIDTPALRGYLLECMDAWEGAAARALAKRLPGPAGERRCRLLAAATIAALRVSVTEWVAGDGRRDLRVLAARALDSMAADLAAPGAA